MKVILANGAVVTPNIVYGEKRLIYDEPKSRDVLRFVFGDEDILALDTLFTSENCETITIMDKTTKMIEKEVVDEETGETTIITESVEEDVEYIHYDYVLRVGIEKSKALKTPATPTTEAEYENRVTVTMAHRTYEEMQIKNLTEVVDVLLLENLLA